MFGVDRFDAILPPGTGAILAVAASRPMVVAGKDGSISVKRQMQVNLTADHRVVYGADGASFLKALADLIENRPESLALCSECRIPSISSSAVTRITCRLSALLRLQWSRAMTRGC